MCVCVCVNPHTHTHAHTHTHIHTHTQTHTQTHTHTQPHTHVITIYWNTLSNTQNCSNDPPPLLKKNILLHLPLYFLRGWMHPWKASISNWPLFTVFKQLVNTVIQGRTGHCGYWGNPRWADGVGMVQNTGCFR